MVNKLLNPRSDIKRRVTRSAYFLRRVSRLEAALAALAWLVAVAASIVLALGAAWPAEVQAAALFFGGFALLATLLSSRTPEGIYVGPFVLGGVATMLAVGAANGLVVLAGASALLIAGIGALSPASIRLNAITYALGQAAGVLLAFVLGGWAFALVNGAPVLQSLDIRTWAAVGAMWVTIVLVREGVVLVSLSQFAKAGAVSSYLNNAPLLLRNYIWVLFVPLAVFVYVAQPMLRWVVFGLLAVWVIQLNANNVRALRQDYRLADLGVLYDFGQRLTTSINRGAVARSIRDVLAAQFGTSHVRVLLYDEDTLVDATERHNPPVTPLSDGPLAHVIKSRRALRLPESDAPPVKTAARSYLGVPITAGDVLEGVVELRHNALAHAFTEEDATLVMTIAAQAASALQNARLYEATHYMISLQTGKIEAIESIMRRMVKRLDMVAVIEQVAQAAEAATGAERSEVLLYGDDGHNVEMKVAQRYDSTLIDEHPHPSSNGSDSTPTPLLEDALKVPIVLDDRRLGLIQVQKETPFTQEQERFLANLADYAAVAVNNARLFQRLNQRREFFDALRRAAIELLRLPEADAVLRKVAETAIANTSAQNVHIYRYDTETDTLTFVTSRWANGDEDREIATPRPNGLTYRVARSGERISLNNVPEHPLFADFTKREDWNPINGILGIPFMRSSRVLAVMTVAFAEQPTREDEYFLNLLTPQAAAALSNAVLTARTRTQFDQLRTVLDSVRDGMVVVDTEGTILLVNSRAGRLLNLQADAFIGHNITELLPAAYEANGKHEAFSDEAIRRLLMDMADVPRGITRREYLLEVPETRAIYEQTMPVIDESGAILGRLIILADNIERYEIDRYRQEMSSMLVHDLRSPLGGVISGLHFALDELRRPEETRELEVVESTLEVSLESANKLLTLVNSILDVNKLEAGEMPTNRQRVNLGSLAQRAIDTLQPSAQEAKISLVLDVEKPLPDLVADPSLLERVFINLLDNALRFSPTGGTVTVSIEPEQTFHSVTITDEGDGVPDEAKELIFERFYQLKKQAPRRGSKGSGLGLNFCKLAVENHGGSIWAADAPGGGAAFHFIIPAGLVPSVAGQPDSDDDE